MRIRFTNVDSTGDAVTQRTTVQYDGEQYEVQVASTGTANVPEDVGQYLVESTQHAVEPYNEENGTDTETTSDTSESTSDTNQE